MSRVRQWLTSSWTRVSELVRDSFSLDSPRRPFVWWGVFGLLFLASFGCLIYAIWDLGSGNYALIYGYLMSLLASVLAFRWFSQKWLVNRARLEDPSYVRALLASASAIEPTVGTKKDPILPENYSDKVRLVEKEVERLENLGLSKWREWELLPLTNFLVDFMPVHVLISQARLKLDDLEDYATDTAYAIDGKNFENQRRTVLEAIDHARDAITISGQKEFKPEHGKDSYIDTEANILRASIQGLQEYIIEYRENWAKGTVTLGGLKFSCSVSIPIFLFAGFLPISLAPTIELMVWFNWAFVAVSGALTSVLVAFLDSNEIEIGHATSRREVSRAFIAGVLGFVSGSIAFAVFGSGVGAQIFFDSIVPTVPSAETADKLLSVVWAFASGFLFEKAIDKIRKSLQG